MGVGGKEIQTLIGLMEFPIDWIQFGNNTFTLIEEKIGPYFHEVALDAFQMNLLRVF